MTSLPRIITGILLPLIERESAVFGGIVDKREIEFNSPALLAVIAASDDGRLRPIKLDIGESVIRLFFSDDRAPVFLSTDQIGGLLISYCIRAKIPIPRNVNKSVRFTKSSVILEFRTVFDEAPIPGASTWRRSERLK